MGTKLASLTPCMLLIIYNVLQHHQWHRIKRKAGAEVIAEDILYNQTVNYTGNSIFVFDQNNKIVAK